MTTLTLRLNLPRKTARPALDAGFERVAVGEAVLVRLVGADLSVAAANAAPLRIRLLACGGGLCAMTPRRGDTPAWTTEAVETDEGSETALCHELDLNTIGLLRLFGYDPARPQLFRGACLEGAVSPVTLLVELGSSLLASVELPVRFWTGALPDMYPAEELEALDRPALKSEVDSVVALVARLDAETRSALAGILSRLALEGVSSARPATPSQAYDRIAALVAALKKES